MITSPPAGGASEATNPADPAQRQPLVVGHETRRRPGGRENPLDADAAADDAADAAADDAADAARRRPAHARLT